MSKFKDFNEKRPKTGEKIPKLVRILEITVIQAEGQAQAQEKASRHNIFKPLSPNQIQ